MHTGSCAECRTHGTPCRECLASSKAGRRRFLVRLAGIAATLIASPFLGLRQALAAGYFNLGSFWKKISGSQESGGDESYPAAMTFAWGNNTSGALGLGDVTNRSSPVQIGAAGDWTRVLGGTDANMLMGIGRKSAGSLWTWGNNDSGQLGLGDLTARSNPTQVGALTTWTDVLSATSSVLAVKSDKSLWSWGANQSGQLGLGDTAARSSPVQVGSSTDWEKVACGRWHSLAVRTGGTLWSWGNNTGGQLGLGDLVERSSPVQIGSSTDWSKVSSGGYGCFAIKSTGTLWAWGNNQNGALGLGDVTGRSTPTQVGALTDWKIVSAGWIDVTAAVKTDGSLWAWGNNASYQLGLGDTANRSSPTRIGSDTDWQTVRVGSAHMIALKTNGTLWSWGMNTTGQLGLGDVTLRSVPTQIAGTTWKSVGAGIWDSVFATKT